MLRRILLVVVAIAAAVASFAAWQAGPFAIVPPELGGDWAWYADGVVRFADPAAPLFDPRLLAGPYDRLDVAIAGHFNQLPVVLPPLLIVEAIAGDGARLLWWGLMSGALLAALLVVWPRRLPLAVHVAIGALLVAQGPIFEALLWGNLSALAAAGAVAVAVRRSPLLTALGLAAIAAKGPIALFAAAYLLRVDGRRALAPIGGALLLLGAAAVPALLRFGPTVFVDTLIVVANSSPVAYLNNLSPSFWLEAALGLPATAGAVAIAAVMVAVAVARGARPDALVFYLLAGCALSTTIWAHWYAAPLLVALLAARPTIERLGRRFA